MADKKNQKNVDLSKVSSDMEQIKKMSDELAGEPNAEHVWPEEFDASGGKVNVTTRWKPEEDTFGG